MTTEPSSFSAAKAEEESLLAQVKLPYLSDIIYADISGMQHDYLNTVSSCLFVLLVIFLFSVLFYVLHIQSTGGARITAVSRRFAS